MEPGSAFRLGFLAKCADDGLTPEQTDAMCVLGEHFEKAGSGWIKSLLFNWPLAIAATGGGLTGYTAAKMTDPRLPIEEIKKQELLAAYKQYLASVERNKKEAPAAPRAPRLL